MKLLLVAATEFEILPILKGKGQQAEDEKDFDILVTGVGITPATYHLTKKLSGTKYDVVIQAGIGGSFTKKVKKGDVVLVKKDAFGDLGIEEKKEFKTLFKLGLAAENDLPFEKGWLDNKYDISKITQLKQVKAVTINKISDRQLQAKQIKQVFGAQVESMEGAALHYVCLQEKIPFLQLRGISNYVGVRDKTKWKTAEAIDNLNREVLRIIHTIL